MRMAMRAQRHWKQERLRSVAALRKVHDELEVKIRERTADAQNVNELLGRAAETLTRELEERERDQEEFAAASIIVENSPVVLGRWRFSASGMGPEGPVLEHLSGNCAQFGYSAEEFLSGTVNFFRDVVHPDDRKQLIARLVEAVGQRKANGTATFRLLRKDGETRWVEATLRYEQDSAGAVVLGQGILRDVTDRVQSLEALKQSEAQFKVIFNSALDGIVMVDLETRTFSIANDQFRRMLGYTPEEMTVLGVSDIHPTEALPHVVEQFERQIRGELKLATDIPVKRKDGSVFFADFNSAPILLCGKQYLLGIMRDNTERNNAKAAIARASVLYAVIASIATLINNLSLDEGAPKALHMVGEALKVDRCVLVENADRPGALSNMIPTYQWNSSGLVPLLPPFITELIKHPDVLSWLAPLSEGKPVITTLANANATVKSILRALKSASILLVPIVVEGRNWGHIGLNDSAPDREWLASDIETLLALATLFGVTIERGRQTQKLADADTIIRHSPTVLYRISSEPGLPMTYVSSNVDQFGYEQAEMLAEPTLYRTLIHPDDRVRAADDLTQALREQAPATALEIRLLSPDGTYRWVELHRKRILGTDGKLKGLEGEISDITERKRVSEQLSHMARHDFLTDLPNRAAFVEDLARAIASARRDGKSFAVLYLDLDHFKDVNDTLGHPIGDLLLQAVAQRLNATIRETDTVARFGGDEFALINSDIGEPADAVVLADKVLKALSEPYLIQGNEVRSGASVGIAVYGLDASDAETLLSHADVALYRAKAEGRGTYRFFTNVMDTEVRNRVALTGELREAITSDQLFLVYQPQVDVDSGRIIGVEALVRWRHPTRGIVSPAEFIPVAEKGGLIVALGRWVLHEACQQMKEWIDAGVSPSLIAVNVSALQFKTPFELENTIAEILAETGLPPGFLELEVTETIFMEVGRQHSDTLDWLRKAGLRIAIDDFGTGYSSLEYLGRFPVNRIKIGQNFMSNLTSKSRNGTIVKTAIGMAHELGFDAILEGVETAEQLEHIRAWNGHKVQGFYFSKPLPAGEVTALLRVGKISPAQPSAIEHAAE
jgi:diguanylate cyclase (GGDEF)-like protein/PAS domain S-box-containing protein